MRRSRCHCCHQNTRCTNGIITHAVQVVREASKRVLGLRPFDVQLMGGMILHEGQIAEMRTGEGKTLVAVLPSYLNALSGTCRLSGTCCMVTIGARAKGVHRRGLPTTAIAAGRAVCCKCLCAERLVVQSWLRGLARICAAAVGLGAPAGCAAMTHPGASRRPGGLRCRVCPSCRAACAP